MYRRRGIAVLLSLALLLCAGCRAAPPAPSGPGPAGEEEPAVSNRSRPEPGPVPEPGPIPEPEPAPEPGPAPEPVPEPEPEPAPVNTRLHILMYHHFVEGDGSNCNDWTLTADRFREDLEWLAGHGYATVLPSEVVRGDPLPERAVMITMDDGYESNYTIAFPILQEHGARAAVSLVTGWTQEEAAGYLTWEECREMAESGLVEFGSHTDSLHEAGIGRNKGEEREDYEARVFPDLQASADRIEEELGVPPLLFAYPHGQTEKWAGEFLRERFGMTVTTRNGSADVSKGLYGLRRYNVSMKEPPAFHLPD